MGYFSIVLPERVGIGETLAANVALSVMAGVLSYNAIKHYMPQFLVRGHAGMDQCKVTKSRVPEPMGVIAAAVYLVFIFLFIPFPFYEWLNESLLLGNLKSSSSVPPFPYTRLLSMLAGVVSICTAILLGFADDMLDLRWRHKLLFPTLSSLPLLLVYAIGKNPTAMLLPRMVSELLGTKYSYIDLGLLFYVYMVMLVIFATNAINIIAGINGVEVGQALIIATSVALFNAIQLYRLGGGYTSNGGWTLLLHHDVVWHHALSLCILLPFIACSMALFVLNKYPAQVFVGDTYCYWAGMTLAVVAILGGFSKTLLLFLVPQVFNFLYSTPQLFGMIPCPRHRLPRLNPHTGLLEPSTTQFQTHRLNVVGRCAFALLKTTRLVHLREEEKDGEKFVTMSNLTILNLLLIITGGEKMTLHEWALAKRFFVLQIASSALAFVLRFYCARLLYDSVQ